MKVKITRNSISIELNKPIERLIGGGLVSGLISSLSTLMGVPIDKDDLSILFLKTFCQALPKDIINSCSISVGVVIILLIISSWVVIWKDAIKIKRVGQIPGLLIAIFVYILSFLIGYALLILWLK